MSQSKCRYVGCIGLGGFGSESDQNDAPGEHIAADVLLVVSLFKGVQALSLEGNAGTVLFASAIQDISECNVPTQAGHICCFVQKDKNNREIMHAFQFESPEKASEIQKVANAAMAAAVSRQPFGGAKTDRSVVNRVSPKKNRPAKTPKKQTTADAHKRRLQTATPDVNLRKMKSGKAPTSPRTPAKSYSRSEQKSQGKPKVKPGSPKAKSSPKLQKRNISTGGRPKREYSAPAVSSPLVTRKGAGSVSRSKSEQPTSAESTRRVPTTEVGTMTDPIEPPRSPSVKSIRARRVFCTTSTTQFLLAALQPDPSSAIGLVNACITELCPIEPEDPEDSILDALKDAVDSLVKSKDKPRMRIIQQANLANLIAAAVAEAEEAFKDQSVNTSVDEVGTSGSFGIIEQRQVDVQVAPGEDKLLHEEDECLSSKRTSASHSSEISQTISNLSEVRSANTEQLMGSSSSVADSEAGGNSTPEMDVEDELPPLEIEEEELPPLDEDEAKAEAAETAAINAAIEEAKAISGIEEEDEYDVEHGELEPGAEVPSPADAGVVAAAAAVADLLANARNTAHQEDEESSEVQENTQPTLTFKSNSDGCSEVTSGDSMSLARHAVQLFTETLEFFEHEPADIEIRPSYLETAQLIEQKVSSAAVDTLHGLKKTGGNDNNNHNDLESAWRYIDTFFLTYRTFLSREDLFTEIRAQALEPHTRKQALRATIHWSTYFWLDFKGNSRLQKELVRLIQHVTSAERNEEADISGDSTSSSVHDLCISLDHTVKTQIQMQMNRTENSELEIYGPTENEVARMRPESIAEQMTLLNHGLLFKIHPIEFIFKNFKTAPGNTEMAHHENLDEFIGRFDSESYWIAAEIQLPTKTKEQASMITKFIKVALHCETLGNYFSVFTIIGALNFPEVRRLKQAWEKVSEKMKKRQGDLEKLMSPSRNMKAYRDALKSHDGAVVPFLPLHLKDIVFAKEAGDDKLENGVINFKKLSLVARCVAPVASIPLYDTLDVDVALQTYLKVSLVENKVPFDRSKLRGRKNAALAMQEAIKDSFLQSRGKDSEPNSPSQNRAGTPSTPHRINRLAFWRERKKLSVSISEPVDVSGTGFNPFMGAADKYMKGRSKLSSTPVNVINDAKSPEFNNPRPDNEILIDDSIFVKMNGSPGASRRRKSSDVSRIRPKAMFITSPDCLNSSLAQALAGSGTTDQENGVPRIVLPPPPSNTSDVNAAPKTPERNQDSKMKTILGSIMNNAMGTIHSPGPAHYSEAVRRFELSGASQLDASFVEIFDDAMSEANC